MGIFKAASIKGATSHFACLSQGVSEEIKEMRYVDKLLAMCNNYPRLIQTSGRCLKEGNIIFSLRN